MALNNEDRKLGLKHQHVWEGVTKLSRLQSAHDQMRWDVAKSRIMSVNVCSVCGELDRESVGECAVADCTAHQICSRPYR